MFRFNKSIAIKKSTTMLASMIVVTLLVAFWLGSPLFSARGASLETFEKVENIHLQNVAVISLDQSASSIMPQRYTATIVARRTSQLAFQAAERVDEILVGEGEQVVAGQLLARQNQAATKAQYDAAVARQNQSAAVLAELEMGPRKEIINAARAELDRMVAQSRFADVTLKRQAQLRESRAISAQEFDASRFDREATSAAASAAQQKLDELINGTRKEKIVAQKAALGVVEAAVAQAKARLDQTELRAPFTGQISLRFVDEGSLPQRGNPVLEIVETGHLEVRFGASPSIAARLKIGQTLTFSANGELLSGVVKQVQPKLDRSTRTRLVIVSLPKNKNSDLIDGQTVRIQFAIDDDSPGFWIPSESLQPQVRGLWSVLIVEFESGKGSAIAKRRDVEVLSTWGAWSRVRGTIDSANQIIIEGGNRISDGQRVVPSVSELSFPWENNSVMQLNAAISAERSESVK